MTTLSYILIYVVGVAAASAAKLEVESKATNLKSNANNGIVGVASFSGITSRNGRVSSMGGIRFFPSIDSNGNTDMNVFYPLQINDKDGKSMYPLSVTKQANGLSSTIQVYPGSVSVSSSARSGNAPQMPWPTIPQYPMNDILVHPPMFDKNFNPWFVNDMIRKSLHMRPDDFRPFLYPNLSPYISYWR